MYFSNQRLEKMLDDEKHKEMSNTFSDWWKSNGEFVDPEPSVSWFIKRRDLCEVAFNAGRLTLAAEHERVKKERDELARIILMVEDGSDLPVDEDEWNYIVKVCREAKKVNENGNTNA